MQLTPIRTLSQHGPIRVELARWQGRLVVVKRLYADSPVMAERLEREAMLVQKLDHDNIVPLLEAEGTRLVYAYCPGLSLAEAIKGESLPLDMALKLTDDVLGALEYAHSLGVIHFDVKPSNVIIKGDRALLTDFGFAKDIALTAITSPGLMLGTPNYMAPEQFSGDRSDPRSDLYSVGAMLYHMMTGEPPYGSQVWRFLTGDSRLKLEPLPARAAPLAGLITTALARSPEARFQSAEAMRSALDQVVQTSTL